MLWVASRGDSATVNQGKLSEGGDMVDDSKADCARVFKGPVLRLLSVIISIC